MTGIVRFGLWLAFTLGVLWLVFAPGIGLIHSGPLAAAGVGLIGAAMVVETRRPARAEADSR